MRNYDSVMYGTHWSSTGTEETPDASVCLPICRPNHAIKCYYVSVCDQ